MAVETYEIVKQYVFRVEGLSHSVKARILRNLDGGSTQPFRWKISHRWGDYNPSKVSAPTIKEAEEFLLAYARGFTNSGVTENLDYDL